jgi:hypothetical protein
MEIEAARHDQELYSSERLKGAKKIKYFKM